ncbi:MAG: RNA-binding S4 domain-containing protein [Pseudomonadota bacterium]
MDKWLWYARVVKTRTLAAKLVTTGKVRVNRKPVDKASHGVSAGDVITVVVARNVRVLEVVAPGARRGPAPEARALYNDLTEPQPTADPAAPEGAKPQRDPGSGRPTKRDRRQLDRLRSTDA